MGVQNDTETHWRKSMSKLMKTGLLALLVLSSTPAMAVAIDTTAAVAQIDTDGVAAIGAVGIAIIGLAALSMVYRWVKATFF
jgi:coat protein B